MGQQEGSQGAEKSANSSARRDATERTSVVSYSWIALARKGSAGCSPADLEFAAAKVQWGSGQGQQKSLPKSFASMLAWL
jgi:hypothetical protein